jgi:hypothetical protein
LREALRFCDQFRGQIVAKSDIELLALAKSIGAVDPLWDAEEHARVVHGAAGPMGEAMPNDAARAAITALASCITEELE